MPETLQTLRTNFYLDKHIPARTPVFFNTNWTGFTDETSFVRAFKKHTSLPPGEFRKSFVYPGYL